MRIVDLMSSPAVTVLPDLSVKAAARLLRDRDIAAAPVVDADGELVGVVSEIDLLRGTLLPDPASHLLPVERADPLPGVVDDVMTRAVTTISPAADVYDAARLMAVSGVRSMPVVEHGRVVGVVSRADLLRSLARDDDDVATEVGRRLRAYFGAAVPCEVQVDDGVVTLTPHPDVEDLQAAELLAAGVPGVVRVVTAG